MSSIDRVAEVLTGSYVDKLQTLTIFNIRDRMFNSGYAFSYFDYHTIAASGSLEILIDLSAFTGSRIVVEPPSYAADTGYISIDYYAGADADPDGTELTVTNRNPRSENISHAVLQSNPTVNENGSKFGGTLVPATGTAPANSSGSLSGSSLPFEIIKDLNMYRIVITNNNGSAAAHVGISISWYEVPVGLG